MLQADLSVLGGDLLVALAAVEQMTLHGHTRLRDGAGLDRLQYLLVLPLKSLKLGTAPRRGPAIPDRSAGNDETAKIFQEARELRIPGGGRYGAMKCEIFVDGSLAAVDGGLNGVEPVGDLLELRRGSALGGKPGGLDLDTSPQLHHVEHLTQRRSFVEVDTKWPSHMIGNKSPYTLASHHQTV